MNRRVYGDLIVQDTRSKELSIFAGRHYQKDDLVFVIAGPIVSEFTRYTIPIDTRFGIDPVPVDNLGRYLNHSCEPNAGIKSRTLVTALRDIRKGEEILIDYAMIVDDYGVEISEDQLVCQCGSQQCRGRLGAYDRLPQELKDKYRGYISEWLFD